MIMDDEVERICKEVVLVYFKIYQHLAGKKQQKGDLQTEIQIQNSQNMKQISDHLTMVLSITILRYSKEKNTNQSCFKHFKQLEILQ
jgi:hypothetical protein